LETRLARLPAMDLMGASELLSSCPKTRSRRSYGSRVSEPMRPDLFKPADFSASNPPAK
jgi:hypothetical protein